ncbi:hypothetical protein, partial [Xanthomonas hortorum]|uniref:hypothetical protein n=1 Tax=Xanthomonas hortorum TaxID=56454 RepID=UPI001F197E69
QSRLELHGIDTHHATSLASGDSSIHPARRRSCDRRLMVRANQEVASQTPNDEAHIRKATFDHRV